MKRNCVALAVAVSCVFAAFAAFAAYDAFRTAINFKHSVQLSDGSVLKPGHYDVQINFGGSGNSAEFVFLQGGMVKGRHRGEARGFASATGGGGSGSPTQLKFESAENKKFAYDTQKEKSTAQSNPQYKEQATALKYDAAGKIETVKGEGTDKVHKDEVGRAQTRSFSWGAAGFGPNTPLKQTEGGGTLTLRLDSSNSPAAIIAILKLVPGSKGQLKQ